MDPSNFLEPLAIRVNVEINIDLSKAYIENGVNEALQQMNPPRHLALMA